MAERQVLKKVLYGDGAHANVLNALEALEDRQTGARPADAPQSICQVLRHRAWPPPKTAIPGERKTQSAKRNWHIILA